MHDAMAGIWLFLLHRLAGTGDTARLAPERLMRDSFCADCHADIAEQHATSMHRHSSFNNPVYRYRWLRGQDHYGTFLASGVSGHRKFDTGLMRHVLGEAFASNEDSSGRPNRPSWRWSGSGTRTGH